MEVVLVLDRLLLPGLGLGLGKVSISANRWKPSLLNAQSQGPYRGFDGLRKFQIVTQGGIAAIGQCLHDGNRLQIVDTFRGWLFVSGLGGGFFPVAEGLVDLWVVGVGGQ